ncbi:MAG TPA: DUF4058 family protein [Caldilineaceae bacterium]|nr:DUF4058 family protein [Caldilineaceae bacterium]
MPLLDHFHPPIYPRHRWHGFHNAWATYLAAALNQRLPATYFAAPNVHFAIDIDAAALREAGVVYTVTSDSTMASDTNGTNGKPSTADWQPPTPSQTVPFEPTEDIVEVLVYSEGEGDGPTVVAAIELASPANKDRAGQRSAFTAKCESCLRRGIGLLVVDVVTNRHANLHTELMQRIGAGDTKREQAHLYAVAYNAIYRDEQPQLDLWAQRLVVGQLLPTMPLWLRDGPCVPVELDVIYTRTCTEQRISAEVEVCE